MAAEKVYADGIKMFSAREGAPEFVRGSLLIGIDVLLKWANDNPQYLSDYKGDRQIKMDLLDGKNGLYLVVNTYKKEGPLHELATNNSSYFTKKDTLIDNEASDSLPF